MTNDRDSTIVERRRAGESFPAIAKTFGKSGPWAWAIVKRLAPDLLGRKAKGTTPRAPRPKVARRPDRPDVAPASVPADPSALPEPVGFSVHTTIQDVRKGLGIGFAHGVDAQSKAVIFTCTTLQLSTWQEQIAKGKQPEVDVPGHLLVRYDGAVGAWANRDQKGRR